MTGQERDEEWVKGEFEQLQCITQKEPDWVLANPEPLEFELTSEDVTKARTARVRKTGILLYNNKYEEYSGFFPRDGEEATRIIECINGPSFDTGGQKETGQASPASPYEAGTCVVVDS